MILLQIFKLVSIIGYMFYVDRLCREENPNCTVILTANLAQLFYVNSCSFYCMYFPLYTFIEAFLSHRNPIL